MTTDGNTGYIHERDHDRIVTALKDENTRLQEDIYSDRMRIEKLSAQNERLIRMLAISKVGILAQETNFTDDGFQLAVEREMERIRQEIEG